MREREGEKIQKSKQRVKAQEETVIWRRNNQSCFPVSLCCDWAKVFQEAMIQRLSTAQTHTHTHARRAPLPQR